MTPATAAIQQVLLFDGDCGFCQRWCDWARRRGAEASISFRPCLQERQLRAQANIADSDCGHAAFFLEVRGGDVHAHRAAAAVNMVLIQLPGARNVLWRFLGRLYGIPGLKQLEDWGYRVIARNRHRLGSTSCNRSK